MKSSAGPSDPGSWNRYAYVQGDPVNLNDTGGLLAGESQLPGYDPTAQEPVECPDSDEVDYYVDGFFANSACLLDQAIDSPVIPAKPKRPIDSVTDALARGELNARLANFRGSNCNKVFNNVIAGYSTSGLLGDVNSTEFYNASSSQFSSYTQNQVSANGSSQTLGTCTGAQVTAQTVGAGGSWVSVLLGANFFSNSNAVYQQNVLLHELLHVYTNGWSDSEIFAAFKNYGLSNPNGDTEDISAWLSTDCKSTPVSLTWWQ